MSNQKNKMRMGEWLATKFYRRKSFFDPTKNYSQLLQKLIRKFHGKCILNIGAGKEKLGEEIITLDRFEPASINADAMRLPVQSASVDLILCIAVLEHLKDPQLAISQMERVLKKGGEVYIEIPFLQPFHGSPNDYYRATLPGLKHWCRNFTEIESGVCVGPGSAVAWLEIEYIRLWFGELPVVGLLIELLFRVWTLPLKYLDRLLIGNAKAQVTASAIYFHGQKV